MKLARRRSFLDWRQCYTMLHASTYGAFHLCSSFLLLKHLIKYTMLCKTNGYVSRYYRYHLQPYIELGYGIGTHIDFMFFRRELRHTEVGCNYVWVIQPLILFLLHYLFGRRKPLSLPARGWDKRFSKRGAVALRNSGFSGFLSFMPRYYTVSKYSSLLLFLYIN